MKCHWYRAQIKIISLAMLIPMRVVDLFSACFPCRCVEIEVWSVKQDAAVSLLLLPFTSNNNNNNNSNKSRNSTSSVPKRYQQYTEHVLSSRSHLFPFDVLHRVTGWLSQSHGWNEKAKGKEKGRDLFFFSTFLILLNVRSEMPLYVCVFVWYADVNCCTVVTVRSSWEQTVND